MAISSIQLPPPIYLQKKSAKRSLFKFKIMLTLMLINSMQNTELIRIKYLNHFPLIFRMALFPQIFVGIPKIQERQ